MNILLISSVPPIPVLTGDRQRTHHLQSALRRLGHVDLLVVKQIAEMDVSAQDELKRDWGLIDMLEPAAPQSLFGRVVRKLRRFVDPLNEYSHNSVVASQVATYVERGGYDLIVVRYYKVAAITSVVGLGVPVALDLDDYDPERFLSLIEIPGTSAIAKKYYEWKASRIARLIEQRAGSFSVIWGANASDREHPGLSKLQGLPNIPLVSAQRKADEAKESAGSSSPMLLVVSSRNRGNVEGIRQFARSCLPKLREEYPQLVLKVVGSNLQQEVEAELRETPGVQMLGRVEDLVPLYTECKMTIAPVAFGAGTSIKVLESFAFGRACVMNRYASRGLEDLPSSLRERLIVESITEMSALVRDLLGSPDKVGRQCDDWVRANRSAEQFNKIVADGLAELCRFSPL